MAKQSYLIPLWFHSREWPASVTPDRDAVMVILPSISPSLPLKIPLEMFYDTCSGFKGLLWKNNPIFLSLSLIYFFIFLSVSPLHLSQCHVIISCLFPLEWPFNWSIVPSSRYVSVSMHVCVRKKESTKEMRSECEHCILSPFITVHQSMWF